MCFQEICSKLDSSSPHIPISKGYKIGRAVVALGALFAFSAIGSHVWNASYQVLLNPSIQNIRLLQKCVFIYSAVGGGSVAGAVLLLNLVEHIYQEKKNSVTKKDSSSARRFFARVRTPLAVLVGVVGAYLITQGVMWKVCSLKTFMNINGLAGVIQFVGCIGILGVTICALGCIGCVNCCSRCTGLKAGLSTT